MDDMGYILIFLGIYFLAQIWILPRMGIST